MSARAQRPVLLGCFQRERFYRDAEPRWRELSRGAECAIVLADFPARRDPVDGPTEVPIAPDDPLMREWAVVCDAPSSGLPDRLGASRRRLGGATL